MIIDRVIGNKKPKHSGNKERQEFAGVATMRQNSQAQQYDVCTGGRRVNSGRAPKLPIRETDNPLSGDFTNTVEAPKTKIHGLLSVIRKIRQLSLYAYFSNKLHATLNRTARNSKPEEFLLWQSVFFITDILQAKVGKKWVGPWVIIGRFGCEYA